ncbi:hypothetical protein JNO54_13235 [Janibacter sp. YIM B02568]|uniref:hypothetical protein n=1 Tax=Janibacter endophyticus TaxID=2806261 RepID=UPI00194EA674|nr:hypothetical protein [Janibacter endophyticus]MBM6547095.1 hypothetical protein [Janibacter endophyticus]
MRIVGRIERHRGPPGHLLVVELGQQLGELGHDEGGGAHPFGRRSHRRHLTDPTDPKGEPSVAGGPAAPPSPTLDLPP